MLYCQKSMFVLYPNKVEKKPKSKRFLLIYESILNILNSTDFNFNIALFKTSALQPGQQKVKWLLF